MDNTRTIGGAARPTARDRAIAEIERWAADYRIRVDELNEANDRMVVAFRAGDRAGLSDQDIADVASRAIPHDLTVINYPASVRSNMTVRRRLGKAKPK